MKKENSYEVLKSNPTLKVLFLVIFGAVLFSLTYIFQFYFWPFLIALILYLALKPAYDRILRLVRKKALASALVVILLIIIFFVPLFFLLVSVANQAIDLYRFVSHEIETGFFDKLMASRIVQDLFLRLDVKQADLVSKLTEFLQKASGTIVSSLTTILSFPLAFIMNFIFMLMILFVLLKEGYRFGEAFYRISPFPDDLEILIVERLKEVIRVLLSGNLFIMFLQGLLLGIGLFISGSRIPILLGSLGAIASLIPVAGTALIWVPVVLYLALNGSYGMAIFLAAWSLVCFEGLENLVKPKVLGSRLKFHPIMFFFLLLGSIQAFGLSGIILGPILLTLFFSLWEIFKIMNKIESPPKDREPEKQKPSPDQAGCP